MTIAAPSANGSSSSSRPAAPHSAQRPPFALEVIRSAEGSDMESASNPPSAAVPQLLQAQPLGFSPEQLAALAAPLDRAKVRQREQGRSRVSYLEGWQVIAEANRIFGFDGWQRQTIAVRCVAQAERTIGRDQKPGWGVTYTARVRITVTAGGLTPLVREGTGAGHGIDADLGQAHESAIKEAETDAMKRALVTFGNPFGLALYDKSQRQVTGATAAGQAPVGTNRGTAEGPANTLVRRAVAAQTSTPARAATPAASSPAADAPLDPATIQALQERIRNLQPPQLATFSKAFRTAFRTAFRVPDSTPSIAGLITEQRHRLWIEQFLSQGQEQSHCGAT